MPSRTWPELRPGCKRRPNFGIAFQKIDGSIWDLRVAVLGEEEAAKRSPEDGKRSPVETY